MTFQTMDFIFQEPFYYDETSFLEDEDEEPDDDDDDTYSTRSTPTRKRKKAPKLPKPPKVRSEYDFICEKDIGY